jgi:radical SAM protein with 4Fe4S-binding SPASM domain
MGTVTKARQTIGKQMTQKYSETDGVLALPPVVRIEPASACNLRCSHCPTGVFAMTRTIMKEPVFERCLSELAKHVPPIRVVSLYQGGEPFLNKQFLKMPRRVKEIGVPLVKTISNGMLIRPEQIDDVVTSGLDLIEISLDGDSPAESDQVRVRADFDRIVSVIRALAEAKRRLNPAFRICISNTRFQNPETYDPSVAIPPPADYLLRTFSDIRDELEFNPNWARIWPSALPADGYDLLLDDRPREMPSRCDLLDDMLNIRSDGRVVACCYDLTSMSNLGNIMEQSLEEIWNGDAAREFRLRFEAGDHHELCKECIVVTGDRFLMHKDGDGAQRTIPTSSLT